MQTSNPFSMMSERAGRICPALLLYRETGIHAYPAEYVLLHATYSKKGVEAC